VAKVAREREQRQRDVLTLVRDRSRTRMRGIMGMTELALDSELKPEQREYLTLVNESADTLLTLINDLLHFSKIEAGKFELDTTSFDMEETVSHMITPSAYRHDANNLAFDSQIEPAVTTALTYSHMLV